MDIRTFLLVVFTAILFSYLTSLVLKDIYLSISEWFFPERANKFYIGKIQKVTQIHSSKKVLLICNMNKKEVMDSLQENYSD